MPPDAALADESHGLTERFNHNGDQKVAAKLDEISGLRRLGDNESLLSDRIEERSCCGDCVLGSGRNNEELTCSRHVRAPKNRCCNETLASFRMRLRERLRQRDTDRAEEMSDPTLGQAINNTTLPSTKPSTALSFATW